MAAPRRVRHYKDMTNNTETDTNDTSREIIDALAAVEDADGAATPEMLDRVVDAVENHPGRKRTTPLPKVRPSQNRR